MNVILHRKRVYILLITALLFTYAVSAANITVTNRLDSGSGSLRDAVTTANSNDSILFQSSLGGDSIVLTTGKIIIGNKNLIIRGLGADKLIISAGQNSSIFEVSAGYSLTLLDISLHSGKSASGEHGGAILNYGTLTLTRTSFIANKSVYHGGAIYSEGEVYITESTFAYNHADSNGGAIANVSGYVEIINSTVSSNSSGKEGGALYNLSINSVIPKIEISSSTILNNHSTTRGGGIANTYLDYRDTVIVFIHSSVVALNYSGENYGHDIYRNLSSRCYVVSNGYNLIGNSDSSGIYGSSGDIMGNTKSLADPMLLPLGYYGGPTRTHGIACNSSILDSGDPFITLHNDQRGLPRKFNGAADMGAFESQIDLYLPPVYLGTDIDTCIGSLITLATGRPEDSVNWKTPDGTILLANNKIYTFTSSRLDSILAEVISPGKCANYDTLIVKLADVIKPVISNCPSDITLITDLTGCDKIVSWTPPTASDNCNVDTFYSNYNPGDTFSTGITIVTYTALDDAGNKAECSFKVTVKDQIFPVIQCPGDIKMASEQDKCHAFVNYTLPVGTDNCAGVNTILAKGLGPDTNFPAGINIERWLVTDASGNKDSCEFTIEIEDNQAPVITCPNDITVSTDSGHCYATVHYQIGTDDNCPNDSLILVSGLPSGSQFPKGVNIIRYLLKDIGGNEDTCSFIIIVADSILPVITCAPTVESCGTFINYDLPLYSDNCPGALMTLQSGLGSAKDFPFGTSFEVYQVEDVAGNIATCSTKVIVHPAPTIDAGNDTTVYLGDVFYLNPKTQDTLDYTWSPTDYLDNPLIRYPLCTPEKSITYKLNVISNHQCPAEDSVSITVKAELFIPTVFTPGNADGKGTNDFWEIRGITRFPDCVVRVYNSWGDLIFESKGYEQAWDGKSGDKDMPTGSYYYFIDLNSDNTVFSGTVMIIR